MVPSPFAVSSRMWHWEDIALFYFLDLQASWTLSSVSFNKSCSDLFWNPNLVQLAVL